MEGAASVGSRRKREFILREILCLSFPGRMEKRKMTLTLKSRRSLARSILAPLYLLRTYV